MKKHLIAALTAVIMCLTVLSSCSLVSALEKDVNVVFEVDGVYQAGVTVNTFNNAIAPKFDEEADGAVPYGYKFMGWSASHDWEYGDDRNLLISSEGIVRYDAVKDYVNEGGTAVAVPIIIDKATIPRGDLVIGWYSNSNTSGIDESNMADFEDQLRTYLANDGYDVSTLEIVIRGYGGNVGTSCGNIRKDGDLDIMLGWAATSNLTGTGSMKTGKDIFANVGGITIGSKARYAALCSDRELGTKVYSWVQEKYGSGQTPEVFEPVTSNPNPPEQPVEPPVVEPEEPTTPSGIQYTIGEEDVLTLKIGCYGLVKTSGITQEIKANFEEGLKAALKKCGASDEQLAGLDVKYYCYSEGSSDSTTNLAALDSAIKADGEGGEDGIVDILLGVKAFSASNGPYLRPLIKESSADMNIGTAKERRVIRFNNKGLTLAVYNWILSQEGLALLATPGTV